jgi:colanic acid/amylovoran biosynthesis glycosyltransferase
LDEVTQLIEGSEKSIQSKIEMLGAMPHLDLLAKLKSADLFILNSRIDENGDSEGFPNSILEAMASKVAVISTRHAGIPTVIKNNFNGILVDEKDTNSLTEAMNNVIHNPLLRKEMVNNAYDTVSKEYTIEGMNRKIQSVFNSI